MKTEVWFERSFDAAHWLPQVPDGHKCRRIHGHTYHVRVCVVGPIDDDSGWIVDFARLKKWWKDLVSKNLDHKHLNEVMPNPTCELVGVWIYDTLSLILPDDLKITEVLVREGSCNGVRVTG